MDMLWLGFIASKFYKNEMGDMMRNSANWHAAIWVYILIPLGVILFVLPKVNPDSILPSALGWGALFGIVLYGVYEFTNLALVKDWPLKMALVDIAWGAVICAVTTLAAVYIQNWLG